MVYSEIEILVVAWLMNVWNWVRDGRTRSTTNTVCGKLNWNIHSIYNQSHDVLCFMREFVLKCRYREECGTSTKIESASMWFFGRYIFRAPRPGYPAWWWSPLAREKWMKTNRICVSTRKLSLLRFRSKFSQPWTRSWTQSEAAHLPIYIRTISGNDDSRHRKIFGFYLSFDFCVCVEILRERI